MKGTEQQGPLAREPPIQPGGSSSSSEQANNNGKSNASSSTNNTSTNSSNCSRVVSAGAAESNNGSSNVGGARPAARSVAGRPDRVLRRAASSPWARGNRSASATAATAEAATKAADDLRYLQQQQLHALGEGSFPPGGIRQNEASAAPGDSFSLSKQRQQQDVAAATASSSSTCCLWLRMYMVRFFELWGGDDFARRSREFGDGDGDLLYSRDSVSLVLEPEAGNDTSSTSDGAAPGAASAARTVAVGPKRQRQEKQAAATAAAAVAATGGFTRCEQQKQHRKE